LCGYQENHCKRKCKIQGGGQEMAVMVGWWQKFFDDAKIQPIPSKTWRRQHNSPELLVSKFFPSAYHHSHFLVATLNFTFFHRSLLGTIYFFKQLGCFGLNLSPDLALKPFQLHVHIWWSVTWLVNIVLTTNLVTMFSLHSTISGWDFKTIEWTH